MASPAEETAARIAAMRSQAVAAAKAPGGPLYEPPSDMGTLQGLAASALWGGTAGLFGVEPPGSLGQWQAQNPWKSLGAEIIGSIPAYSAASFLLPLRALEAVPLLGRAITAVGPGSELASRAPSLAVGLREALHLVPFEATRIAGSGVAEQTDLPGTQGAFGRTALSVPLELGGVAALGAAASRVAQMRPFKGGGFAGEASILEKVPGAFSLDDTPQAKLEALAKLRERAAAPDAFPGLSEPERLNLQAQLEQASALNLGEILRQEPAKQWKGGVLRRGKYVEGVEGGDALDARTLNWIFRPGKKADIAETAPLSFGDGMPQGLPAGWEQNVQFPRRIRAQEGQAARLDASLRELLPEAGAGPGTLLGRRPGGLWVGAMQEEPGSWIVFQTANPRHFAPSTIPALERTAYLLARPTLPPELENVPAFKEAGALEKAGGLTTPPLRGPVRTALGEQLERLPAPVRRVGRDLSQGARSLGTSFNRFFAPRLTVLAKSPRAVAIGRFAETMARSAEERAARLFFGDVVKGGTQEGFRGLVSPAERTGGVDQILGAIRHGSLEHLELNAAWFAGLSPADAAARGYGPKVIDALSKLDELDKIQAELVSRVQAEYPEIFDFKPRDVHYKISRMWTGNLRARLYAEDPSKALGYASGSTAQEVERDFLAIRKFILERGGPELHRMEIVNAGREGDLANARRLIVHGLRDEPAQEVARTMSDLQLALKLDTGSPVFRLMREQRLAVHEPTRFQPRTGAIGFRGTVKPLAIRDMQRAVYSNIIETERLLAQIATKETVGPAFLKLQAENPTLANDVSTFVHQLFGGRTEFNRQVAAHVDKVLGPFMGQESAAKITQVANRTMYNLTLNFLDIGAGALNMVSIITQALPELAAVMGGAPERLASSYSYFLVQGRGPLRQLGVLDASRLLRRAFGLLSNPTPEFRAALHDYGSTVAPKMFEEFSGEMAAHLVGVKDVLKGNASFSRYMLALNEFTMAKSEEFSRLVSFALGYDGARQFLLRSPEEAALFAAQFTKNSMYGYGSADRARIITGPLGSLLGLFKNWGMQNFAQTMRYGKSAFLHQQWSPFLWMMGSLGTVAGLGSLPFIGAAEAASRLLTDKPLVENLYGWFGKRDDEMQPEDHWFLDTFYYGLPAFLGVTLQNRASAPGSDMVRDVGQMMSSLTLDRLSFLRRALGQAIDYHDATGRSPFEDPRTRDLLIRAVAPRTVYRAASITAQNYVKSFTTGNPMAGPLSELEQAAYILGFEPLRLAKEYEINELAWSKQDQAKELVQRLGAAFATASLEGNEEAQKAIMARAISSGAPLPSVMASARAHYRNTLVPTADRAFDQRQVELLRQTFGQARIAPPPASPAPTPGGPK